MRARNSAGLGSMLDYFDGRPTAKARQRIMEQQQLKLNDALLRLLVAYGILVSGD